jgi:WD40 repeat protein
MLFGTFCLVAGCGDSADDGVGTDTNEERPEPEPETPLAADAGREEPEPTDMDDDTPPEPAEPAAEPSPPVPAEEPAPEGDPPTPVEPDDVPAPVDSTPVEPVPAEPDAPAEPALWHFLETDVSAYVHNLLGDETQTPITGFVDATAGLVPWSPEGTQLAQVVDGEVLFYALADMATVAARFPALEYAAVAGWIPGFGALLIGPNGTPQSLGAMKPDGTEIPLSSGAGPGGATISPDGGEVAWTMSAAPGDGSQGYILGHCTFTDGEAGEPEELAAFMGSPALSMKWSPDGNWLAYGISAADEGGIYVWQKGTTTPIRVSPDGAGYNPLYGWSPDSSKFVLYVGAESGSGLYLVTTSATGPSPAQLIVGDEGVSPAEWTGDSALLYQAGTAGWLLPIGEDGAPGQAIEFPDPTCGTVWRNESEFFHSECLTSNTLTFSTLTNGALTSTEVAPTTLGQLALSSDGSCLMEWSDAALRVGLADAATYTPNDVTNVGPVSFPSFAEGGSSLVYTALGVSIQYVDLESCVPAGEPLQRVASGIVANSLLVTRE